MLREAECGSRPQTTQVWLKAFRQPNEIINVRRRSATLFTAYNNLMQGITPLISNVTNLITVYGRNPASAEGRVMTCGCGGYVRDKLDLEAWVAFMASDSGCLSP